MHTNREKALADAAYYKALKEIESNKVTTLSDILFSRSTVFCIKLKSYLKGQINTGILKTK
jgi:hypothetical protein